MFAFCNWINWRPLLNSVKKIAMVPKGFVFIDGIDHPHCNDLVKFKSPLLWSDTLPFIFYPFLPTCLYCLPWSVFFQRILTDFNTPAKISRTFTISKSIIFWVLKFTPQTSYKHCRNFKKANNFYGKIMINITNNKNKYLKSFFNFCCQNPCRVAFV